MHTLSSSPPPYFQKAILFLFLLRDCLCLCIFQSIYAIVYQKYKPKERKHNFIQFTNSQTGFVDQLTIVEKTHHFAFT